MAYKILVSEVIAEEGIQDLVDQGYEIKYGKGCDYDSVRDDIADCDAVIVRTIKIDKEIMNKAPKLKVIAKHGAGYDSIDVEAAKEKNIRVTFTPNAVSLSVAEHTLALILASAKKIPFMSAQYRCGNYKAKDEYPNRDISQKVLGLVGLGRIGRMVASMAANGFQMKVMAYDPFIDEKNCPKEVTLVSSMEELLENADYVSLHIPATEENRKFMDSEKFKLMKPTAYLINCARGTLVDEEALAEAIRTKKIAGAALDVTDPEPEVMDSPLFGMPEVILTPHCASGTYEGKIRMAKDTAMGIIEVLSGNEPTYKVV